MHLIYTPRHKLHNPAGIEVNGQPFEYEDVPERVETIHRAWHAAGLGAESEPEDHGLAPILAIHSQDFIDYLQTIYQEQAAFYGKEKAVLPETLPIRPPRHRSRHIEARKGTYSFGTGTPILNSTWEAAYWSAQCALSAVNRLRDGMSVVYALCRPPGHHAATDMYGGYCFLNNAAIAARALGGRGAILDIDFHHGNGTQEIFYSDPSVLFCSLHADPDEDYPYFWGSVAETGEGEGVGYTCNWPLPKGTGDDLYLATVDEALAVIARFRPQWLVVSAGFDTAEGDPVGGFHISRQGFQSIGGRIAALALPTIIVQEGGYLVERLGENAIAFLKSFA